MRYSIEPKDRIYVKEYGFLSFTKNTSSKYSQKILDTAKKSASKRAIQKNAEATSDLIGNTIADKITNASRELHSKKYYKVLYSEREETNNEIPKERYISREKRQQISDKLSLV